MLLLLKKFIHTINISRVINTIKRNLTRDVFLSKKNEVIIYYSSKIYAIWYDEDILMLSSPDPYTGSSFSFGNIDTLIDLIKNDPYKEYGIQSREAFENLKPKFEKYPNREDKNKDDKKGKR